MQISVHDMLKSVIINACPLKAMKLEPANTTIHDFVPSDDEIEILRDLCSLIEPIRTLTMLLSGRHYSRHKHCLQQNRGIASLSNSSTSTQALSSSTIVSSTGRQTTKVLARKSSHADTPYTLYPCHISSRRIIILKSGDYSIRYSQ